MLVKKHIYIILKKKLFADSLKKDGYIKITFREKIRLLKFAKRNRKIPCRCSSWFKTSTISYQGNPDTVNGS